MSHFVYIYLDTYTSSGWVMVCCVFKTFAYYAYHFAWSIWDAVFVNIIWTAVGPCRDSLSGFFVFKKKTGSAVVLALNVRVRKVLTVFS